MYQFKNDKFSWPLPTWNKFHQLEEVCMNSGMTKFHDHYYPHGTSFINLCSQGLQVGLKGWIANLWPWWVCDPFNYGYRILVIINVVQLFELNFFFNFFKKNPTWVIFNNIPDFANHQFLVLLKNQNQGIADSGYFKNLEELCILMKEQVVYGRLFHFSRCWEPWLFIKTEYLIFINFCYES